MKLPLTRKEKSSGAFLAAALGAIGLLGLIGAGGRAGSGDEGEIVLHAAAPEGFGAVVGSPVKVHGVEVGAVTAVELVHDAARPDRPVRLTLRVSAHGGSFLRERTVAHVERIHFGAGVPPFATPPVELRTEGSLPLARGAVIDTVGDETMVESFAQLTREVAMVRRQFLELGGLFHDVGRIAAAVADGEGAAGRMLRDPAMAAELEAALRDARAAAADTRRLIAEARAATARAPGMIDDVAGASREGKELVARMITALEALPRVVAAAERTLAVAEELAENLRVASGYAPELARKVDASIEETNRLVEAAERSVILRSTLPARRTPRTEAEVRPPLPAGMDRR
jgi:ABC-type transporter Mla subunit MlaD